MATRFWVGGTGTWDASTTTNWAATTGGAGGQSVPGVNDTVTFDGASGGGTVTVNTTVSIQSLTMGAFTGTLDFSANNNNVNITVNFSNSGSGVRTLNMGNGTWTISQAGGSTPWNMLTVTNLTFNANGSTLNFTGSGNRTIQWGGKSYNTVGFSGSGGASATMGDAANTIATLNATAPYFIALKNNGTLNVTNAINIAGISEASLVTFASDNISVGPATISSANNGVFSWSAFRAVTFQGGGTFTASNSLDLGNNTGITITPPAPPVGKSTVLARGTPY